MDCADVVVLAGPRDQGSAKSVGVSAIGWAPPGCRHLAMGTETEGVREGWREGERKKWRHLI